MDDIKDFETFYTQKAQPLIDDLRKESGVAGNWGIILILSLVLFVLAFLNFIGHFTEEYRGLILFLCFLFVAISTYLFTKKKDNYTGHFKNTIIREVIEFLSPGLTYIPGDVIAKEEYKASSLYRRYFDYYDGDDYIEGIYKNVPFRCSELSTQYDRAGRYIGRGQRTIFKGLFFAADISHDYRAGTYIWSRGEEQIGASIADERYRLMNMPKVFGMNFQNKEFESCFSVFSSNPAEGRIILTDEMMQCMVQFKKQLKRNIGISIVAGKCYVAIPIHEDLLEPSGFGTDDREEIKEYFFTILLILSIINQLRLYKLL